MCAGPPLCASFSVESQHFSLSQVLSPKFRRMLLRNLIPVGPCPLPALYDSFRSGPRGYIELISTRLAYKPFFAKLSSQLAAQLSAFFVFSWVIWPTSPGVLLLNRSFLIRFFEFAPYTLFAAQRMSNARALVVLYLSKFVFKFPARPSIWENASECNQILKFTRIHIMET